MIFENIKGLEKVKKSVARRDLKVEVKVEKLMVD
jgi:hypothetical protein